MRAHYGDLVAHSKTGKHRKNATPFSSTRTLFDADVMMYAMSVYKQTFIVHRRTVGGAQLQGMMETSTHH